MGHGRAGQAMAGLNRTWQGMAGHNMALQGMQGVAHMAGSYHLYEASFFLTAIPSVLYCSVCFIPNSIMYK